jgi:hypothetical protein
MKRTHIGYVCVLTAQHVQGRRRENTHNGCVLVDSKSRTAADRETHFRVGFSVCRLRNSVVIH